MNNRLKTLKRKNKHVRELASTIQKNIIKAATLLLTLISESLALYYLIGIINKRRPFIHSVFICYAGSPKYAQHYVFNFAANWMKWRPVPIGILRQGNAWGLAFGTPMSETDFTHPKNKEKLYSLVDHLQRIAHIVGAEKVTLSGILPSFLEKNGKTVKGCDNRPPALAVYESYKHLCQNNFSDVAVPAILLGGNGSVGKHIQAVFKLQQRSCHVVDPAGGLTSLPKEVKNKACILIDVSRRDVLKTYADDFWPEMVILNETFPEPPKALINNLKHKGIKTYHLAGVEGRVYPSLPYGYKNSVPCCAIHDANADIRPIIKELSI